MQKKIPCEDDFILELQDENDRAAYLVHCVNKVNPIFSQISPVKFDAKNGVILAPQYEYEFNPKNHLLFRNIAIGRGEQKKSFMSDSYVSIRSDFKNFFTLNFDDTDIISQLESYREGPLGVVAQVSFYLKILFFKIRLQLTNDVNFFIDSAFLPATTTLPANAFDYLHPKSGIIYGWKKLRGDLKIDMPILDPKEIENGISSLQKIGLSYCRGSHCPYQVALNDGDESLIFETDFPRELVSFGFFPFFFSNAQSMKEKMGWKKIPDDYYGFYYETSQMPKGQHLYDLWIRLGSKKINERDYCPRYVHGLLW